MFTQKRLLIGAVVTSGLYVGFAATVPNPEPGKSPTTGQKIAKYIKPRVIDKALDKVHDKVVDLIMEAGAEHFPGGPFSGGDKDATRDVVSDLTDPRQWNRAPIKMAVKALQPSNSVDPIGDSPGSDPASQSSRLPFWVRAAQEAQHASDVKAAEKAADLSAHPASKVPSLNDFLTDDDFESPTKPLQGHGGGGISTSSKGERTTPDAHSVLDHYYPDYPHSAPVPDRSEWVVSHGQQQTLEPGHQGVQQMQEMDIVRTSDGHYQAVPRETQTAPTPPAAATTGAPTPTPTVHESQQMDMVQTSEGHYKVVPRETQAAPTPAAAAAAATPTPTVHESKGGDKGQSGSKGGGGDTKWAGGDAKSPGMEKIASTASR